MSAPENVFATGHEAMPLIFGYGLSSTTATVETLAREGWAYIPAVVGQGNVCTAAERLPIVPPQRNRRSSGPCVASGATRPQLAVNRS